MNDRRSAALASEIFADMNRFQLIIDLLAQSPMCRYSSARVAKHIEQHCREQQQALHAEYKQVLAKWRARAEQTATTPK